MTEDTREGLVSAGCDADLVELYGLYEETGDVVACKQILQKHRIELLCALHEAQRPIDVCDWLIRDLEKGHGHGAYFRPTPHR